MKTILRSDTQKLFKDLDCSSKILRLLAVEIFEVVSLSNIILNHKLNININETERHVVCGYFQFMYYQFKYQNQLLSLFCKGKFYISSSVSKLHTFKVLKNITHIHGEWK